jgi:hypothetical protein
MGISWVGRNEDEGDAFSMLTGWEAELHRSNNESNLVRVKSSLKMMRN